MQLRGVGGKPLRCACKNEALLLTMLSLAQRDCQGQLLGLLVVVGRDMVPHAGGGVLHLSASGGAWDGAVCAACGREKLRARVDGERATCFLASTAS